MWLQTTQTAAATTHSNNNNDNKNKLLFEWGSSTAPTWKIVVVIVVAVAHRRCRCRNTKSLLIINYSECPCPCIFILAARRPCTLHTGVHLRCEEDTRATDWKNISLKSMIKKLTRGVKMKKKKYINSRMTSPEGRHTNKNIQRKINDGSFQFWN